jgi:hypothetical protein
MLAKLKPRWSSLIEIQAKPTLQLSAVPLPLDSLHAPFLSILYLTYIAVCLGLYHLMTSLNCTEGVTNSEGLERKQRWSGVTA